LDHTGSGAVDLGAACLTFCHALPSEPSRLGPLLVELGLISNEPRVRPEDHAQAVALAGAVRRVVGAASRGQPLSQNDVATINSFADDEVPRAILGVDGSVRRTATAAVLAALSAIARDAIEVVGTRAQALRWCEGPRCGAVFVDESRAGRRRWCSMARCGNRAKAQAFQRRLRGA
jgi:predicted RNA-binding Zn ribbon-like protein